LVRVVRGQRRLTLAMVSRLVAYLHLRPREAEYLRALATYARAPEGEQRRRLYGRLMELRAERKAQVAPGRHEFYRRWYYSALREYLRANGGRFDEVQVARTLMPRITPREARAALATLVRLGFVAVRDNNSYAVTDPVLTSGERWHGDAISSYQVSVMEMGARAVDMVPKKDRDMSTLTVTLSRSGLEHVRAALRAARDQILAIEEGDELPLRVYQVNFQCFPLSREIGGEA
jgi:uncharacterized protein (TIGR02147 family)